METKDNEKVIQFLLGIGSDASGRRLKHYLGFSNEEWETQHDIIQWAFPLATPSAYHPTTPVIDKDILVGTDYALNSIRSNQAMLAFNYLMTIGLLFIATSENVQLFSISNWSPIQFPGNHNQLRITRLLTSLRLLGNEKMAQAIGRFVLELADKSNGGINNITREFWYNALHDNIDELYGLSHVRKSTLP